MAAFNNAQLQQLWVKAGGSPQAAPIAAAVALAESSGNPGATNHNTNGTTDRGLWQINSIHGGQSTYDILGNVRAAIAISNNGRNWQPWTTYNSGAYRQYLGGQQRGALPQLGSALSSQYVPGAGPFNIPGGNVSWQGTGFNQRGFQQAERAAILGNYLSKTAKNNPYGDMGGSQGLNALFAAGKATTGSPDPMQFEFPKTYTYRLAQSALQGIAGKTILTAHPVVAQASGSVGAGSFLPKGARYTAERKDQGRDGITNPGGPMLAPGNGYVVKVLSDPNGFGPAYPLIHFVSGPYAGRTIYYGHTLSVVKPGQRVRAGQVVSHTGTHGVGNATVPGWFEVGFADSGTPGPFGQATPF